MNLALFFARKMRGLEQYKNTVSTRIINIATIAVALGVSSILIATSTSRGLQKEIQNKTSAFNGHILVTLFENNESQISVLPIQDKKSVRKKLKKNKNLDRFHSIALKAGMLKNNSDFEGVLFKGVSSNFKWSILDPFKIEGNFPDFSNAISKEILISEILSRQLNLKVGDQIDAFFLKNSTQKIPNKRRFKVSGIYFSGFPDIDNTLIYCDLRQIQKINRWDENLIGGYELFVNDFSLIQHTSDQVYNSLPSELNSIPISDRFSSIFQWIALFDFNILIILVVMILVGVTNMATALLVLILERSRMVGLLKAIGAKNTMIQKIFLYNGVFIISRGLFFGNLIGLGFYYSQKLLGWIRLDPSTYFVEEAPVSLSYFEVLYINLFFLFIFTFLLWLPSRIILRISPSKVLRLK